MAKEMMIIFVYDTEMVQKEEDDPASAILYFHPSWVSDQQKAALCGQLMGTVHCVKSILSAPKIVSLQSGKFFVKECGRYLMAVGTDRNVADWLLEHRAQTMAALIGFFHEDIPLMAQRYDHTDKLSTKLYQLFETYLKYLFIGGNIFSYIPSIKLPKSASYIFLEAIQILQSCQELDYVLGGSLLYHNKVVATQLSSDLTKRIVLTDPYRIKCPGEQPTTNFELPIGVQLIQVYVSSKEYYQLFEEASKCKSLFQYLSSKNLKKFQNNKPIKEPVISAMKRDQSIIFTALPEEDSEHQTLPSLPPKTKLNRPKFLNLKSKTSDFKIEPKPAPPTPFNAQTSVCSTPMTDLSRVIHSKPLSICLDPSETSNEPTISTPARKTPKKEIKIQNKCASSMELTHSIIEEYYDLKARRKTICDPIYPLFGVNNRPISVQLHQKQVVSKIEEMSAQIERVDPTIDDFIRTMTKVEANDAKPVENIEIKQLGVRQTTKNKRKSLTLPLKSLDGEAPNSPLRRHSSSALLTPLMAKLSTFDDRGRELPTPFTPIQPNFAPFGNRKPKLDGAALQRCVLFVCGQQDMVVYLLLQEDAIRSEEVVGKLWEICTENLGMLEKGVHQCLEMGQSGGNQKDSEVYSYLYLDPEWDTIHRGGPWESAELGALTYFHRDFKESSNLTEILMRGCDGVIYGYQCGKSEVFYHQSANGNAGLPTPADVMGSVPMKARRRLERDHSIILL